MFVYSFSLYFSFLFLFFQVIGANGKVVNIVSQSVIIRHIKQHLNGFFFSYFCILCLHHHHQLNSKNFSLLTLSLPSFLILLELSTLSTLTIKESNIGTAPVIKCSSQTSAVAAFDLLDTTVCFCFCFLFLLVVVVLLNLLCDENLTFFFFFFFPLGPLRYGCYW